MMHLIDVLGVLGVLQSQAYARFYLGDLGLQLVQLALNLVKAN